MGFFDSLFGGSKQKTNQENEQIKSQIIQKTEQEAEQTELQKMQTSVNFVFPYSAPPTGKEGFILHGYFDGKVQDITQGYEIQGSKILVIEPTHKDHIVNKGKLASRILYQKTINPMNIVENLDVISDAIKKVDKSKDGIAIIECRSAKVFVDLIFQMASK